MTGEPPSPTQTVPPGTPDEKLTLLIATLLDIILTILEALPIPSFLRRPLQNRARHECAALLTRLLATRVPAPATTPEQAPTPQPPPTARPEPHPTFRTGPIRLDHEPQHPPCEPIDSNQVATPHAAPAPDPAQPLPTADPSSLPPSRQVHPTRANRFVIRGDPPTQNLKKPAKAARPPLVQIVTI